MLPGPSRAAAHLVGAAVGDVEPGAVAARIEAVGAGAGVDQPGLGEGFGVDHENAVGAHVGDIEHVAAR